MFNPQDRQLRFNVKYRKTENSTNICKTTMVRKLYLSKIEVTSIILSVIKGRNAEETDRNAKRLYEYVICRFKHFMLQLKSVLETVLGSYKVHNTRWIHYTIWRQR